VWAVTVEFESGIFSPKRLEKRSTTVADFLAFDPFSQPEVGFRQNVWQSGAPAAYGNTDGFPVPVTAALMAVFRRSRERLFPPRRRCYRVQAVISAQIDRPFSHGWRRTHSLVS
jgi:hypothetical protein